MSLFLTRIAEKFGLITNKLKKINSQKKHESIIKKFLEIKNIPLLYLNIYLFFIMFSRDVIKNNYFLKLLLVLSILLF